MLPCTKGLGDACGNAQTQVWLDGGELHLLLKQRKNMDGGASMSRKCWCQAHPSTCPVHVLGNFFEGLPIGDHPFAGISAGKALRKLREALGCISATRKDCLLYRCHDLRRGHAKDLVESGASLIEILGAGQWRSPAFLKYLDLRTLERDAVLAACVDDSSGGEDESAFLAQTVCGVPVCPLNESIDSDADTPVLHEVPRRRLTLVCPHMSAYLTAAGWPCDAGPVNAAALWLSDQGIRCERDLAGMDDLQFLPNAESLPLEAIDFLQSLEDKWSTQVCRSSAVSCV